MISNIKEIGKMVKTYSKVDFVFNLVEYDEELILDDKDNRKFLVIFDFDMEKEKINLSRKEMDNRVLEEYLWVGNKKGSSPQDRFTTNNISYLIFNSGYGYGSSLINILYNLKKGNLKELLEIVKNKFFIKLPLERERYCLNLNKIQNRKEILIPESMGIDEKLYIENLEKKWEKEISDIIKEELGLTKKEISLYTITINGRKASEFEEYKNYIEQTLIDENFEENYEGICHICGERKELTYDTARFPAKFYITKLITFSSYFEGKEPKKGFSRNFSLCKDCYKDVILGIKFIQNHLGTELGNNSLWIIPGLFFNPLGKELKESWIKTSRNFVKSTFNLEEFLRFEEEIQKNLEEYREFEELMDHISIDLLFYEKSKEAFKVKEFIKDVHIKRIEKIKKEIREVESLGKELFGERENWFLGLENIYFLIPIRRGRVSEYKKLLDLYEDIFLEHKLDKRILINYFVELAKIYIFEKFPQYNIRRVKYNDLEMSLSILKTNLLLKLFEKINLMEGGDTMSDLLEDLLDADIQNYLLKMKYGEEETALFLLGYLIGEIGYEQVRGGDLNAKKPILNKINFNGISNKNLINLSNEIFEKLDQYRIRGYNEKIFSAMKTLMDKNIKSWKLNDNENVYYILSGYAFNTYKRIKSIKGREEQ
ncbi:MAG: TIGR02556 family CRISPR-associated protein [Dictyoglomaceae bacterium]|nr:TIGR02556 family CRISPR-associated protein [Dictyoglomaceae bacterium]